MFSQKAISYSMNRGIWHVCWPHQGQYLHYLVLTVQWMACWGAKGEASDVVWRPEKLHDGSVCW